MFDTVTNPATPAQVDLDELEQEALRFKHVHMQPCPVDSSKLLALIAEVRAHRVAQRDKKQEGDQREASLLEDISQLREELERVRAGLSESRELALRHLRNYERELEASERVRAENVRLSAEKEGYRIESRRLEAGWDRAGLAERELAKKLTDSDRLVSELRADNARLTGELSGVRDGLPYRDAEIRERGRREGVAESEGLVAELRVELAKRDEKIDTVRDILREARDLRAEIAKREALVVAARGVIVGNNGYQDIRRALAAIEQPQAEPGREIVVGSTWRNRHTMTEHTVRAIDMVHGSPFFKLDGVGPGGYTEYVFRAQFEWVSDPPVSEGEG
ncbi:MAG TPA: hypothetical protein VER04_24380 [Polyangiaceae bacterium]|nr:hypothetical protein [Polyangiaceae bacterium]